MRKQRRLGTIDLETGEIIEGLNVHCPSRRTSFEHFYGWRYCLMAQTGMERIAKDKELSGQPLRVLMYMVSKLDFENFIRLRQNEIAQELEMQKADVSRAIKLIESKGILQRGPKVAQTYTYRMNPNYGYKGDPKKKLYKDKEVIKFKNIKEEEEIE